MNIFARPIGRAACLACILAGQLALDARAGEVPAVIYDNIEANGGPDPAGASPASQTDPAFPFEAAAADDFILPASPLCRWGVTGLQWTGKYWNDATPGAITGFRIVFWNDDAGTPRGGGLPTADLNQALAVFDIAGSAGESSSGPDAYAYEATLPSSLELMPGVRYWVQIQAIAEYPPQWGLHITQTRLGLGPMQYFDLLLLPAWTAVPDDGDLAFRLLGLPQSVACDDGNACTADSCAAGSCVSTPITCDDGSACTTDSCDPSQGCQATPITCADEDLCTVDACDPSSGCTFTQMDCTDSDPCTIDICVDGVCEHLGPPDFDGDGDVDLADYTALDPCVLGVQAITSSTCTCTDLNADGQVDLYDIAVFQQTYTGSK